jgi:hypothetical protein
MSFPVQPISRVAAALGAFAAVLFLAGTFAAPPARGESATSFHSNGDLIAGWSWLRDDGLSDYAEYRFADPPRHGNILIDITALATDGVNGAPDVNAWFDLLVGFPGAGNMGGVFHRIGVTLENIYPEANPPGYTNHGMISLPRERLDKVIPASGELFVRIVRGSARGPHVAFRPDSIQIVRGSGGDLPGGGSLGGGLLGDGWPGQGGGGDNGPDGAIVRDQRGTTGGDIVIERGGGTVTPPDGVVTDLRPELGDWGDEGQCVLDRPCVAIAADGFRSTGFSGAEGWFWLRAPTVGQNAEYLFSQVPEADNLVLDIAVLGQTQVGVTPKDTVHVNLTLGYPGSGSLGGQIGPVAIALPRLWSDPDDDTWRARALVVLPGDQVQAVLPAVGGLFLHFERIDAFEPDIGFSAGSVLLYPAQDIGR